MSKNISLEQSLQAYRIMNTPTQLSWKQHWACVAVRNDVLAGSFEQDDERLRWQGQILERLSAPIVVSGNRQLDKLDRNLIGVVVECFHDVGFLIDHMKLFCDKREQ